MSKESFGVEKELVAQKYNEFSRYLALHVNHNIPQEDFLNLVETADELAKQAHLLSVEQIKHLQNIQAALDDIGSPKNTLSAKDNEERKRLHLKPGVTLKTTFPMKYGF